VGARLSSLRFDGCDPAATASTFGAEAARRQHARLATTRWASPDLLAQIDPGIHMEPEARFV
jgi:hypothetical protein